MKMRKYGVLLLLVVVLTIATFVIPAFAESETVYYVKADGTGDYTDLFAAIEALPAGGGKVVVASDLTITASANPTIHTWTAKTGKITVTGENNPTITFTGPTATKNVIECTSEIEWNNLTLVHTAKASTEFYCGPSVIIGQNMTFLAANVDTGVLEPIPVGYNNENGAICFRGGNYTANCVDTRMEFYSGRFSYIQGGNNKKTVTGTSTIIVHSGVTVTDFIQCGGTQKTVNNVNCTIDGATVGYVYLSGYNTTGNVTGNVSLTVKDSTITALYGPRFEPFQDVSTAANTISGSVNVTLDNSSVTTVDFENLTVSGSKNLTLQNCEGELTDNLSSWDSVTLTNSTMEMTNAYAGPTDASKVSIDANSKLVVPEGTSYPAIDGIESAGGTNPDPETPAGENVVFLSGEVASSGDGKTPATAVKTLMEAYNKLGDQGGTIILCGNLTEDYEAGKFVDYPAKAVVITSKFDSYDYTDKVFTMNNTGGSRATLQFHATTVFANIHLNETNSANKDKAVEFFTGPKLVFGEGVVTTYNGGEIDAGGDGRFAVRTGFYSKAYVAADYQNQPATFLMQSGTLSFIQGGNHSKTVDNSYICLEGTAKVTVMLQCGGTNNDVTNSVVEIKSNAIVPQMYVSGYGSANMTSSKITISGGTVDAINAARPNATGKISNVDMTISGTASVGAINLEAAFLTEGTQKLTLAEGLGDQTMATGFGDGWDTIAVNTGNDVTINGALTIGSAALSVGKDTTIYISETANSSIPAYTGEGTIVLVEAPDHLHNGSNFEATHIMTGSGGQGNAIYGNYIFCCTSVGKCYIYDLTTGQQVAGFNLGSYNGGTKPSGTAGEGTSGGNWTNHSNQVMFGASKFDESDPFPLLYVTTGNSGKRDGTGAYIAKCAIERIRRNPDGTYYSEIVQIIEFNDFDNIPEQDGNPRKNQNDGGELQNMYNPTTGRFDYISGNGYDAAKGYQKVAWGWPAWFVDSDPTSDTEGKIYIKSVRYRTKDVNEAANQSAYGFTGSYFDTIAATGGTINAYIVTEFTMPALPSSESDANYGKTVTLYPKDIENQFETEYSVGITQGGTMYQGKIYYSYGWRAPESNPHHRNAIQIFDIAQEKIVAKLWLYKNATLQPQEPECCSIWNGKLMLGLNGNGAYQVYTFDYFMIDVDAKEPTCTQDGTVAHAVCSDCPDVYYSQSDYRTVLDSIAGEKAHGLQHVEYEAPGDTVPGNIEYWYCEKCDKYYSDADAKTEITQVQTVLPATNVLGDANRDGVVTVEDATLIKQYRVGLVDASALNTNVCDLDGNKVVDVYDAYLIQIYVAKIITAFPVEN